MKATSVTAHIERKLNTGDYSSVTFAAWATVEVEDGEDPGDVLAHAMSLCREQVKEAAAPFAKRTAVTMTETMAGLPVATVNGGQS